MPMIHTPLDSPVCTEPTAACPTAPARAPPSEPLNAPSAPAMLPIARPSKPCCAAATCSVFRMSNLITYLVDLSLPMPSIFRAACGSPRLYASSNSRSSGPRFERSSTWKLAFESSSSPKSAMLLAVNFCRNVALLLLISPGMTISAGPLRFLFMYSTGRYSAWSADWLARCDVSLPAVGDGLPNVGCASTEAAPSASAAPSMPLAQRIEVRWFMCHSLREARSIEKRRRGVRPGSLRAAGASAVVGVQRRHHLVGLFIDERERHALHVGAGIGARARLGVGDHAAVASGQREPHVHRHLVHVHHRIRRRLRRDEPAQHETRAKAARRRQRGVGIVAEIRVDLRLRDLAANLLGRERAKAERLQALVDGLVVASVILLVRLDVAVRLALADDHHDLLVLELGAARHRQALRDAILALGCFALLVAPRVLLVLREAETLRAGLSDRDGEREQQQRQCA